MTTAHLAYDDLDSTSEMVRDASACRAEAHIARAVALLGAARSTVDVVPGAVLQAPRQLGRTALAVSESAAKFAGSLFD
ncbi:hypothetical protein [Nocardioides terrisoli]|uniref:hypothetical protein n=1 Tax=Nocardioides terrisoli TaxID=3388267 RepID=UPI00287B6767|nr:hypothetical protein [Nocardioides marmorisolisilvae]